MDRSVGIPPTRKDDPRHREFNGGVRLGKDQEKNTVGIAMAFMFT
eukprot:SAG31_NODE_67_length_28318_cov_6.493674_11_plen_45_part_00